MATTRLQLKTQILNLLNKTSATVGFFSDAKVNDAIQDCLDFISLEMFMGGDGFLRKIVNLTSTAGSNTVSLPSSIAIIYEVRYLQGERYIPIPYRDGLELSEPLAVDDDIGFPASYRIIDNKLYFSPTPSETGAGYVQVEHAAYPAVLSSDTSNIDSEFGRAMIQYAKWRCASILASQVGKTYKDWQKYEDEWNVKMLQNVNLRIRGPSYVQEFPG